MTIEAALSVAGLVLVFALLWRSNRVTDRRLSEIQWELNALRDLMSRILLTQMSEKPRNEPPLPDGIPRSPQRLRNEKPRLRRRPVFGLGKSGPRSASRSAYSSHSAAAPADYKPSPRCCASFRSGPPASGTNLAETSPRCACRAFSFPPPPVGLGSREVTHRSSCARRR